MDVMKEAHKAHHNILEQQPTIVKLPKKSIRVLQIHRQRHCKEKHKISKKSLFFRNLYFEQACMCVYCNITFKDEDE